ITPLLPGDRGGSWFQWASSAGSGIDLYAGAISDIYQDLFQEGSYTGKGIYDVDAFEAALAGKVPINALLSHDLFEGIAARTALASDIELFEEFPADYRVAAARQHRWARGDWQLLPWLLPRPAARASDLAPMLALGRWKILDNLRRSLLAPAAWLALLAAWLLPLAAARIWTAFILAALAFPALLPLIAGPARGAAPWRNYARERLADVGRAGLQVGLSVLLLAAQAWLMLDAIARTLGRLFLTHRNLLEWGGTSPVPQPLRRWIVGRGWLALPWLLLWALAPLLGAWLSKPRPARTAAALAPDSVADLRAIARRSWRFFEVFVAPPHHWLPPDGVQEDPKFQVAARTSPTNIGLSL